MIGDQEKLACIYASLHNDIQNLSNDVQQINTVAGDIENNQKMILSEINKKLSELKNLDKALNEKIKKITSFEESLDIVKEKLSGGILNSLSKIEDIENRVEKAEKSVDKFEKVIKKQLVNLDSKTDDFIDRVEEMIDEKLESFRFNQEFEYDEDIDPFVIPKLLDGNKISLKFPGGKPLEMIRDEIKNEEFRWNKVEKYWFNYLTKDLKQFVLDFCNKHNETRFKSFDRLIEWSEERF